MRILDNCVSRALYKIFGVFDNESVLRMRHCLGLPSLMNMIENRRCNFMDRLLDDRSFTVMCNYITLHLILIQAARPIKHKQSNTHKTLKLQLQLQTSSNV